VASSWNYRVASGYQRSVIKFKKSSYRNVGLYYETSSVKVVDCKVNQFHFTDSACLETCWKLRVLTIFSVWPITVAAGSKA
jgi:hypothetical protein